MLDLQKFENECQLITQDIRVPFDVPCSNAAPLLHISLDDVDNHQIVESIVIPNVRHSNAEEHANPGS